MKTAMILLALALLSSSPLTPLTAGLVWADDDEKPSGYKVCKKACKKSCKKQCDDDKKCYKRCKKPCKKQCLNPAPAIPLFTNAPIIVPQLQPGSLNWRE